MNAIPLRRPCITSGLLIAFSHPLAAEAAIDQPDMLEEIIVSSQKTERPLQETPNAVTVLSGSLLDSADIRGLDDLSEGLVPSLKILPFAAGPTSLTMTIRGYGPTDAGQVTRESSVGVYKDGFYLGRIQGLAMEMADLERLEVFRGPQGTMFGRNATGGAVNLVTKKPTGEFNLRQTVGYGNYGALRTITRLDLPEVAGVRVKFDYIHSERDGWLKNTAPDQSDYHASNMDGGGVTINADLSDTLLLEYDLDLAWLEATQGYYHVNVDNLGIIGTEPNRASETRFPVTPLQPTTVEHQMHSLTLTWQVSDSLTVKSLTSYRDLEEDTFTNFAGAAYFNGLTYTDDIRQEQWTQEVQLLGSHDRIEWVMGLYYFKEDVFEEKADSFSLNIDFVGGTVTPFDTLVAAPVVSAEATTKSKAIYGQATWTPPIMGDKLDVTFGLRYTDDDRTGTRTIATTQPFEFKKDKLDPLVVLNYHWTDDVATYAKWSTAFKAGGVSIRSTSLGAYDPEDVETFEVGLKADFLDHRLRINAALFSTDIDNAQLDFPDPAAITVVETINATETVEIDGMELEVSMVPLPGLVIGLNYTYLDASIPPQPNPLAGGAVQTFVLPQTPEHAGSVTVDYTFPPTSIGTFQAHMDLSVTDEYHYVAFAPQGLDAYAVLNARLSLTDIDLGNNAGNLEVSLWGKNLFDTEYVVVGFPAGAVAESVAYGTPRTYGLDLTYRF